MDLPRQPTPGTAIFACMQNLQHFPPRWQHGRRFSAGVFQARQSSAILRVCNAASALSRLMPNQQHSPYSGAAYTRPSSSASHSRIPLVYAFPSSARPIHSTFQPFDPQRNTLSGVYRLTASLAMW
jgi:hypothetical protein